MEINGEQLIQNWVKNGAQNGTVRDAVQRNSEKLKEQKKNWTNSNNAFSPKYVKFSSDR